MRSGTKDQEVTRGLGYALKWPSRRFARRLAPHVDPEWAEVFATELRVLGVAGTRIGDALGEVDSHCGEGAESAREAFGDPAEYARSLRLPIHADTSPRATMRSLPPTVLLILGMFMVVWSFVAWSEGGRLEITTAQLVAVAVIVLATFLLARFAHSVLRFCTRHPLAYILPGAGGGALGFWSTHPDGVVLRLSAGWSLAAGSAALIGGMAWAIARHRAQRSQDGPVTSPLD